MIMSFHLMWKKKQKQIAGVCFIILFATFANVNFFRAKLKAPIQMQVQCCISTYQVENTLSGTGNMIIPIINLEKIFFFKFLPKFLEWQVTFSATVAAANVSWWSYVTTVIQHYVLKGKSYIMKSNINL